MIATGMSIIKNKGRDEGPTGGRLMIAYGMNMVQRNLPYGARRVDSLILRDWKLVFSTHATLEREHGAECGAVLWEINLDCEQAMDCREGVRYEDPDLGYYRREIVRLDDGREALVYLMNYDHANRQDSRDHTSSYYIRMLQVGHKKAGLPQALLDRALEGVTVSCW